MLPSEAMPITTVTKMTGPVTVLMTWMKASASHLAFLAVSGATRPNTIPAAIAMRPQNHSWPITRRRGWPPSDARVALLDIEAPPKARPRRGRRGVTGLSPTTCGRRCALRAGGRSAGRELRDAVGGGLDRDDRFGRLARVERHRLDGAGRLARGWLGAEAGDRDLRPGEPDDAGVVA